MRKWAGGDGYGQIEALPLDFRDALPEDHAAREFLKLAGELDLSAFEAKYRLDGQGRPPYPPKAMLALILYCLSKNLQSGRDIAKACVDDIGARLIMNNAHPDKAAINRFRKDHKAAIERVFPQTLRLGDAEGLADLSVVAGDGTKFVANAAMSATVDEPGLLTQITDLEKRLWRALEEWATLTGLPGREPAAETLFPGDLPGDLTGGTGGPEQVKAWRKVCTLRGVLGARRAALTHLRQNPGTAVTAWQEQVARDQRRVVACRERLEQARTGLAAAAAERQAILDSGGKIPGRRPVPVEEHIRVRRALSALETAIARATATAAQPPARDKVNTTDPFSRIMPGKHDGYDQRYNIQALACKNQFILAITIHDNPNDKQAMVDLLKAARANLDTAGITRPMETALFDNGYASESNFTTPVPVQLLLVAAEKECRQTGRLRDEIGNAASAWQNMADLLAEPANRDLYKRRSALIEPLFAQLFNRFGRNLTLRGENVETELYLLAITHNLLKIIRSRRKNQRSG